jgi:hypothetical protein
VTMLVCIVPNARTRSVLGGCLRLGRGWHIDASSAAGTAAHGTSPLLEVASTRSPDHARIRHRFHHITAVLDRIVWGLSSSAAIHSSASAVVH